MPRSALRARPLSTEESPGCLKQTLQECKALNMPHPDCDLRHNQPSVLKLKLAVKLES